MTSKRVLFLGTGNSCRSQMAEAIVNARLSGEWQAFSAGTKPAGYIHPKALQALEEIGIQHSGRSKQAGFKDIRVRCSTISGVSDEVEVYSVQVSAKK